ncbi:hypothetical protein K1T71_000372 [Dendrolimus kikuchii]|uniref:Uncharacterized protein n=1 Tax=Dendrolimus kikuchii TaxID=765133 RepID=A0ACC1DIZ4_9NEOP|nr:hypothetical protein K1T71_000372 [Dendrolimus kikuchii]
MQVIKLVTFDATNTLLKFLLPPWKYYALVAEAYGYKGTPDEIKGPLKDSIKYMSNKHPNFGNSSIFWEEWWRRVIKLTFKDKLPEPSNIEIITNELIELFRTTQCWGIAHGAHNILRNLRADGKYVGVISNFDPRLHDVLHNLQIYDKLDFVITSYEIGISKPDKQIFETALLKCNRRVKPIESLHIGDDFKNDYEGARAAGWYALLVGEGEYETPPAPNHVFNNLVDLSLVIEKNMLKL